MLSDSPTQEHPRAEQCAFLWGCGAGGSAWQAGEPRASLCCREGSSAVGLQCHQGRALVGHVQLQLLGLQTALHPLLEGGGGDGVEDGIQGAVDGQDEDDHPRGDGACANKDTTLSSLRGGCPLPRGNPPAPAHATKRGDALHRLKWGACNYCSPGRGKGPGKPVPLSISSCSPCVGEESSKLSRTYIEGPPTQGLTAGSSQRWALLQGLVGNWGSPGISTCSRESSLRRKMGIQQRASVKTMKKNRFAMVTSREQTPLCAVLDAVMWME